MHQVQQQWDFMHQVSQGCWRQVVCPSPTASHLLCVGLLHASRPSVSISCTSPKTYGIPQQSSHEQVSCRKCHLETMETSCSTEDNSKLAIKTLTDRFAAARLEACLHQPERLSRHGVLSPEICNTAQSTLLHNTGPLHDVEQQL